MWSRWKRIHISNKNRRNKLRRSSTNASRKVKYTTTNNKQQCRHSKRRTKSESTKSKRIHSTILSRKLYKPESKIAQEYVKKRKLSNETLKAFRLGFSGNLTKLYRALVKEGFKDPEILESGLVNRNENGKYIDRYRNRLMFPICDARGRVIAFGGRVLDDSKPKYINTNDTVAYNKGRHLFGLNVAKRET